MISLSILFVLSLSFTHAGKTPVENFSIDKLCGNEPLILDGDERPGITLQLTNSNKYKANLNCTIRFKAKERSQQFVITIEKMEITDCPGDSLRIYDGTDLINKESKQQCGSPPVPFSVTSKSDQISMVFTSNSAVESSGFQAAIALHFSRVADCPQIRDFFRCKNSNCISKNLQGDKRNHCGDNTDEN